MLSSDAVRYFLVTTKKAENRTELLSEVIEAGKGSYPLEDGWLVLNEARMKSACADCASIDTPVENFTPTIVPEGAGSLAEAIVAGDTAAAMKLIGNRPMFALADAASDLDAIYRMRQGKEVRVSKLLKDTSAGLSDEQLKETMQALTSALDGTYDSEEQAVKMAITRAIAIASK